MVAQPAPIRLPHPDTPRVGCLACPQNLPGSAWTSPRPTEFAEHSGAPEPRHLVEGTRPGLPETIRRKTLPPPEAQELEA